MSCHWTADEVDSYIQKQLLKASTLYGASREMLLRENRLLRCQLEEHLVTSRTSRPAGVPTLGRTTPADSKIKQAYMMQGPHMESIAQLRDAIEGLDSAERSFKLPTVRHAEMQADDGSIKYIQTLEKQLSIIAGQKLQLMQQAAALTEQNQVLDMKLEGLLDQLSELRRQKTDMLAHQENLSKDLREHLLSEAKRADAAEAAFAEAKLSVTAAREAEASALQNMERAMAEAQAMQAALQEKAQQVDTLRGLYLELRETLERLAHDVTSGQQEAARQLLDATRDQFLVQGALLDDLRNSSADTHRAAQHATEKVTELAAQQRVLVTEVTKSEKAAISTLGAFERQLDVTQQMLQQSEVDRTRLTRQVFAARALDRLESQRHEKAVRLLLHEVPQSVAQLLAPELHTLAEGTRQLAEDLEETNNTLVEAGSLGGGSRMQGALHAPMVPDVVDDASTQLLATSRQLRAQLLNLSPKGPWSALGVSEKNITPIGLEAQVDPGQPSTASVYTRQQSDAVKTAFRESGREPAQQLQMAVPSPMPTLVTQFNMGSSAPFGPPGLFPGAPTPGLVYPAGFMDPYLYKPANILSAPLQLLQPPARLDLVLKLPPGEFQQSQPPSLVSDIPSPLLPQQYQLSVGLQTVEQKTLARDKAPLLPTGPQMDEPSVSGRTQGERQHRDSATHIGIVPSAPLITAPSTQGVAPLTANGSAVVTVATVGSENEDVEVEVEMATSGEKAAGPVMVSTDAPTRNLEDLKAGVEAGDGRVEVSATRAGTDCTKQGLERVDGPADEINQPADVWVPSLALLEAFKNIPV
ncbi:hypothetical protein Vretimale_14084 [Volvox reticuliferus]|nr:hypothetical protein Vretimale_14084 [Volvox reticuliferus]